MDSAKNVKWITPFKKFGMVKVKLLVEEDLRYPAIFQAPAGTRVEPLTFCKLQLTHMKESKVCGGIQTHSNEGNITCSMLTLH